ncbi:acyl-CoA synthetase (AMP-forming)/AMP-acid ligase II [Pseudonocardia hierapolitana]|uniref:Acyl-CoA synthetase (AMP-forming)/AMP-acid ligase II n=1 Tax=Pseudonocardia hierapolitana TaxID=1128676 RepID=A0A561SWC9_9PSEU|nr:AMP-binding protein [Pseudonocardia hierapolitana]TWF79163.1 acyl-CoA synthetase (AMP-forming)/AMP-acid ligase II [Pseudonocardia hierapolitana]
MVDVARVLEVARSGVEQAVGSARAVVALTRNGVVRPIRPDRLLGMTAGLARYGLTITAGYTAGAVRHPDRTAIVDDAGALTFAELATWTDAVARGLAASGVGPGTRLGLLCRNHRGAIAGQIAGGKLGADAVLLNVGLSATQLREVAGELRLHTVVADEEFEPALAGLPGHVRVVTDTALGDLDGPGPLPRRPPAGHTIVLTSGTTGTPKGARRPPVHSISPAAAILSAIPLRAGEPAFIAAPLLHTWGYAALQLAVLHGSPVVLARRYSPAEFLRIAEEHRVDAVFAVPVMLQRVLELPAADLGKAWSEHRPRIVAVSGSALPAALATTFMDRFGEVLYNLYGSTEVSWVSIAGPADLRAAPGTAGRAPLGTRLVILGDDDRPVPPGTEGRVFVHNDMPFAGYTRDGADVERRGRMIGTGDVGRLDERGLLHLTGRADDMIVSGGENVHPGPVEDLIAARPEVREAAVTGVPDDQYGQRLAAYVVLEPGVEVSADDVRGWVRAELSRFAVPRDVEFVDELPRNATGKVVHRELGGTRERSHPTELGKA